MEATPQLHTRKFFLNTADATKLLPNEFQFDFEGFISHSTALKGYSLFLKMVDFTNLATPINIYNNVFAVEQEFDGATVEVAIPPGNYTIYELVNELAAIFASIGTGLTYTVDYNSIQETLQFTSTGNFKLLPRANSIYALLGFEENNIDVYSTNFVTPHPVNIGGAENVQILVDAPLNNYSSLRSAYFLDAVPLTGGFGSYISYTNTIYQPSYVSGHFPERLTFRFVDDKGRPYDLPDTADVKMLLFVTEYYDHPPTFAHFR